MVTVIKNKKHHCMAYVVFVSISTLHFDLTDLSLRLAVFLLQVEQFQSFVLCSGCSVRKNTLSCTLNTIKV